MTITANPLRGHAPLDVAIKYTIQPHPDNREACFSYEGPKSSYSCFDVSLDDRPTRFVDVKRLPPGLYRFAVVVGRSDGSTKMAYVDVCSMENEDCFEE